MTLAVERMLWRLDAYDQICAACKQNGVAPLRFLSFRPEKLRIRIGESLMRSQVPIIFAPDLADRLGALLPKAAVPLSTGAPSPDRDTLRRWLALAQIDGDLDAYDVASYAAADDFLNTFAAMYGRFFDEARGAGSGEETAAFFQLVASSSLRNTLLHRIGASERFFGLAALLGHLSDRALSATVDKEGEGLSARLGLLLAAANSPLSLMGSAMAVASRPGNTYRTIPSAYTRAKEALRTQLDRPGALDVQALRARLAAELLASPDRRRDLVRAMLADAVRDLALLSTFTQGSELRELAGKSAVLADALFTPLGPEKLRRQIERHPRRGEEPLGRLLVLIDSVGAVLAGDLDLLKRIGSVEERASLAAAGGIVLALDETALDQGQQALAMVRPVPPAEARKARDDGRAYWFGLDDEPLFLLPRRREEAFLFADMKDFTKRTAAIHEEAMGDFLKRLFYEPILKTCAHLMRNPGAHVSVVNLLGDAVAARGDIGSMVALAVYVRRLLEDAADELAQAAKAATAGVDHELAEITLELSRVEQALAALPGHGTERLWLETQHKELEEGRAQRLAKTIGSGLEAGVFIAWGPEAKVIEVGGVDVGMWRVVIAEALNAAARGTNRSAALQAERNGAREADEKAAGRPLANPFRVHTSPDPNDVSSTGGFHNAGAALSGTALAAFRDAARDLHFRPLSIPRASLPPRLQRYWITRPVEELVLCSDAANHPVLLFRKSGRTIFRGLEVAGGIDVWEIVLVDRGFGRDLVDAIAEAR